MITGLHHVQLAAPPSSEQQMRECDGDLVIPDGRRYRRCDAADPAGNRLEFLYRLI